MKESTTTDPQSAAPTQMPKLTNLEKGILSGSVSSLWKDPVITKRGLKHGMFILITIGRYYPIPTYLTWENDRFSYGYCYSIAVWI